MEDFLVAEELTGPLWIRKHVRAQLIIAVGLFLRVRLVLRGNLGLEVAKDAQTCRCYNRLSPHGLRPEARMKQLEYLPIAC